MNIREAYKEYDDRVQTYMNNVIECLEEDYGKIPNSWRVSLDLIANNYSLYLQANDILAKEGIVREDKNGNPAKHPCVSILNAAQSQLKDLLKSFALTPMSKSKMKSLDTSVEDEKYLDDLINGN